METLSGLALTSASIRNMSMRVCLPVVSGNTLLSVYSDQIDGLDLQPDDVTELNKAFFMFPYPPQSEMAALAQRCSLHLHQVRVWFMLQRLRYGISWDGEDICKIRQKLCSSSQPQGENGHQQRMREELRVERREEQSREGEVMEYGGERAGEEEQVKEKRVREGGKRDKVRGKKRGGREMTTEEGMMEEGGKRRGKTETQTQLLRQYFVVCPFPSKVDYDRLVVQLGLPRQKVARWFWDTRYQVKKGKVRWVKQSELSHLVLRIKHRQQMKASGREMMTEEGMMEEGGKRDKVRGKKRGGREMMTEEGMMEEGGKRDKVRGKKRGGREMMTEEGMMEEGGKRDKVRAEKRGEREMTTEEGMTEEGGKRDKVRGKKRGGREMTTEEGMMEEGGKRDKVRGKKRGWREMTTEEGMMEEGGKRDKVWGKKRGGREMTTEEGMMEEGGKRDKVRGGKTETQTQLLRQNFVFCPFPSKVDYDRLGVQLGLPRQKVVRWFYDTRYQVKKRKVRWLKQSELSHLVLRIKHRQQMKASRRDAALDGEAGE